VCGEGEGTVKKMGDAVTTRRERLEGECASVEATLKGAMDHNIHQIFGRTRRGGDKRIT
jgi:hypothetical protein